MNKLKIYKIFFAILIIIFIFITIIIILKYSKNQVLERENEEIVKVFKQIIKSDEDLKLNLNQEENAKGEIEDNNENQNVQEIYMKGFKVIGVIKIQSINLEYPILEKTTKESMKISISKFWGGDINSFGNVSLAGHNNKDGTMFGKNKKIEIDDKIELTNLLNETIIYSVYDICTVRAK